MLKNNKGITLIALVITIIVLLILAGVSIAMLTGDNGILTQARNADVRTARAEVADKINMALNGELANLYAEGKFTATTAADILTKNGLDAAEYEITPASPVTTGTGVILTITGKGDYDDISGTITRIAEGKYTVQKASYPDGDTTESGD